MPLDLEAIRKRCEAATRGPWAATTVYPSEVYVDAADGMPLLRVLPCLRPELARAIGEFAAHARTDLPDAIAELTATRAILADALAEVRRLKCDNAKLHNAGLTLLGIVSELHKSLFYEHTEPQNYTEPPEVTAARAALEGEQP